MKVLAIIASLIALSAVGVALDSSSKVAALSDKVQTLQIVANSGVRSAELIAQEAVKAAIAAHVKEYHSAPEAIGP